MPDQWTDPPVRDTDLDTLTTFLRALRDSIERKVEGVSPVDARRPMVPSGTSLAGLVRHLADVENYWFRFVMVSESEIPFYGFGDDGAFSTAEDVDLGEALDRYRQAQADTDRIVAASTGPDQLAARAHGEQTPTLRWALVHVIDETARHAGHADILRELLDGEVGR